MILGFAMIFKPSHQPRCRGRFKGLAVPPQLGGLLVRVPLLCSLGPALHLTQWHL